MLQVQLEQFEGPLGLLLYLIRKEEMDIYDIPIHKITQQYLEYIRQMKQIDLEKAGDFIAMAATLIQIKAKMLLPSYDEDGEEIENEDPRKPLVQRLLEYQKFQDASKELYDRPLLNRDVWKRGAKEEVGQEEGDLIIEDNALFALISIYRKVVRSAQKATHKVTAKLQSIAQRILEIKDLLPVGRRRELRELVQEDTATEFGMRKLVITFLSSLELGKLGFVRLFQDQVCGPLYLEAKKEITGDIISQVEEFEYEIAEPSSGLAPVSLTDEDELAAQENDKKIEQEQLQLRLEQQESPELVENTEDAATDDEIEQAEMELLEQYGEDAFVVANNDHDENANEDTSEDTSEDTQMGVEFQRPDLYIVDDNIDETVSENLGLEEDKNSDLDI